jgi:pyruvate dehydrogenase E2 component (dihydrolipoamide acetyltransferase)
MRQVCELLVPDIGDFKNVPIVEVLVKEGDRLTADMAVVTLESDKASMEVPAEVEGQVVEILVQEGDTVSEGSLLLRYSIYGTGEKLIVKNEETAAVQQVIAAEKSVSMPLATECRPLQSIGKNGAGPASPSVRRLARELGVDIAKVTGSGSKGRLKKEDIQAYVKEIMKAGGQLSASESEPLIDFSMYGPVRLQSLNRVQKISGLQLAKNWAAIPHVTSFDEADITDIETFRHELNQEQDVKLTLLPFIIKAVQHNLKSFPQINSSLQGDQLIIKDYYHIGFAVDTPTGLLVPVIRDVDRKGLLQIASEVSELAALARNGTLKSAQMQGGTFTISSLGSAGGTFFTPIINAPEVAILALGRSAMRPVWNGTEFIPKLILPLSLSWDHRAIDGVMASRFNAKLCTLVKDFRRAIL